MMAKWIKEMDCGAEMLRCGKCDARVILKHYRQAVGLKGYDHCPYCGEPMERPKKIQDLLDRLR